MYEPLLRYILSKIPVQSRYAVVVAINANQTIDCVDLVDMTLYKEVQLTATETEDTVFKMVPKIKSTVIISSLNNSREDWYVSMFSEINECHLTANKITFNEGNLGGLVKIKELESNLENLKTYCETLKTAVASGISAVGAGAAANGASGASAFNSAMASAIINFDDMENNAIKQ